METNFKAKCGMAWRMIRNFIGQWMENGKFGAEVFLEYEFGMGKKHEEDVHNFHSSNIFNGKLKLRIAKEMTWKLCPCVKIISYVNGDDWLIEVADIFFDLNRIFY